MFCNACSWISFSFSHQVTPSLLSNGRWASSSRMKRPQEAQSGLFRNHLVQTPAATVRLADVENVSPNSFKKMCTDHKNVTQRKCLLMRVPRLGTRRFNPHKECTAAPIRMITSTTPGTQMILHCRIISSITSLIGFSERRVLMPSWSLFFKLYFFFLFRSLAGLDCGRHS